MIPSRQINQLDSTGASQLERLHAELNAKGIVLSFVEVKSALREALHRTGIEEKIGVSHFYESIEDGVQAFLRR
ncbi:hypothetical protein LCGC14_2208040 [marine sediment metagenome]|uniref:STAS domain-containing protein n=1 Tax=marine sediment metagenome TaxID=412755 RepID=A0A0F9E224_9ZZZZ